MKDDNNGKNGKGSAPRPVQGNIFRNNYDSIFGKNQKFEKKIMNESFVIKSEKKKKKEFCPHCGTNNLIKKTEWLSKCKKCGWQT